ncbi:hypothetical protein RFI_27288, partial [Reticulomyxa filosa]
KDQIQLGESTRCYEYCIRNETWPGFVELIGNTNRHKTHDNESNTKYYANQNNQETTQPKPDLPALSDTYSHAVKTEAPDREYVRFCFVLFEILVKFVHLHNECNLNEQKSDTFGNAIAALGASGNRNIVKSCPRVFKVQDVDFLALRNNVKLLFLSLLLLFFFFFFQSSYMQIHIDKQLSTLTVAKLNMYLRENNLTTEWGRKQQLVDFIQNDIEKHMTEN